MKIWLIGIGASVGIGFLLSWATKKLPGILAEMVSKRIDDLLSAGDAIDDKLILALCRWAEEKADKEFPEGGAGDMKYALVAGKLIAMLPMSIRPFVSAKSDKIAEVIKANVERLKAELQEKVNNAPLPPETAEFDPPAIAQAVRGEEGGKLA